MGIDIRTPADEDEDDASGSPWYAPGGLGRGIVNGSGQTSGQASGQATSPSSSSQQFNQLLQNAINALNSNGQAPATGFTGTAKTADMFAVDFLGFNFGSVNAHGSPNIDIMEDAVVAIGGMKRERGGWAPFDMALLDDQESDVVRIIHRQMDEQAAHGDLFDMTIHYYDPQGTESSTMYLVDCEFIEVETDPLNQQQRAVGQPLKVVVTVQPKLIRYS